MGYMHIGERIRELRVSKLMTQSELAGNYITRNMLSCIENGTANPSLSTITYIAKRLNVPAGFLLAEEGDELVYRKMSNLSNIKGAYIAGDVRGCRELCISGCITTDDEIALLLASCDAKIAEEEFLNGRLHSSCRFFDEALSYAEKTIYPTDAIEAEAKIYFQYMENVSPTLYSELLDEKKKSSVQSKSLFALYVEALDALNREDFTFAENYLRDADPNSFWYRHISIRRMILQEDYKTAIKLLLQVLNSETPFSQMHLYIVLCELEICYRELEDFKEAYRYANERVVLLEQFLKET